MIKWITKTFEELTIHELYAILRLRSEVFVVEQHCVYEDIDNTDQLAVHVMGYKTREERGPGQEEELVAYSRVFAPEIKYDMSGIGRVAVLQHERGGGIGRVLVEQSIKAIEDRFGKIPIRISAQAYLEKFYASLGFISISGAYDDDGIMHIDMVREPGK